MFSKAQTTAIKFDIARYLGVSAEPFFAWAVATRQDFSRLVDAAYGSQDDRVAVVSDFLNSL